MSKNIKLMTLILLLVLSALACNLPFLASEPAGTPAPTDAGFPAATSPAETAPESGETPPPGEAATEEAPAATPVLAGGAQSEDKEITIATTDTLVKSGLMGRLIDGFRQQTGYEVKLEAGGTGRAFRLGEKFIADVLLVNNPGNEVAYINSGIGKERIRVMHTDYVIVGSAEDPAGIRNAADAVDAFKKIAGASATFVTRDADVPVIRLEKSLWQKAGITPSGGWYVAATDSGTVGVLKLASDKKAYTLTDRATFLENKDKFKLEILFEGDVELYDIYNVITHDPAKSPKINGPASQAFVDYLLSPAAQEIIAQFGVDTFGQPVYFPAAGK